MALTGPAAHAHDRALGRSVLDGSRPANPTTQRLVDSALLGCSTDRSLHAAALWLSYVTRSDLDLDRSLPKRWVLGLDELIDSGHLEAAAYAAPRLHTAFPKMPYLEHMALVFERLPAVIDRGRELFVDDRDNDVQMVCSSHADTVVLAFCGIGHRLGLSLSLIDRWFAQLGSHVIYLRDRQKVGFTAGVPALGRGMAATVDSLTTIIRELDARRVVCTGNSAGGAAALRYAHALGADRVLALSPITGGREFVQQVQPDLAPGAATPWTDLVPLYRAGTGAQVRILYGADNDADRQQSQRMAGLPLVQVEAIPGWESHHLVGGLLQAGRLSSVLGWLTANDQVQPPPQAHRAQLSLR